MLGRLARQLQFLLRRQRSEDELEREVRLHIEFEIEDRIQSGMSAGEARRTALADFGSRAACQESVREAWGLRIWADLRRDFQYAIRMIRRNLGFAFVTVLTLAIGIGANAAVFSVFDRMVLQPLPYRSPERLVHLWETRTNEEFAQMEVSHPNFQDWKKRTRFFEEIGGYNRTNFTLTGRSLPIRVSAVRVTSNLLPLLGIQPRLGRHFLAEEEADGSAHVVIVTHGFWQRQFGGREDALNQFLQLGGVPHQVIGVLPADFEFAVDKSSELFVPLAPTRDQIERRSFHWIRTIARLKPAIGYPDAEAELKTVASDLANEYRATNAGTGARLVPLQEQIVGRLKDMLVVIFASAACMLCVAFANLANLISAQTASRHREIALRAALGAGSSRLARQLISECLVLAALAGAASLIVAEWTLQIIRAAIPQALMDSFTLDASAPDARVFAFCFGLTILGALIGGSVSALRLHRYSLIDAIKESHTSPSSARIRSVFTIAEVTLAVMLLVGTTVMLQSIRQLFAVDPGFAKDRLVSMQLSLPAANYPRSQDVTAFYSGLQRKVSELPGVENAAIVDELPLTTDGGTVHVQVQGRPEPAPGQEQETVIRSASPRYFETVGIRVAAGRTFRETDHTDATKVVVLNETLARQLFGSADPLGQKLVMPFNKSVWEIIGIAGDVHLANLDRNIRPTIYTCSIQDPSRSSTLVVRTAADSETMANAVRAEVRQLDAELPVYATRSIEQTINMTSGVATRRLVLYLVGSFGLIGGLMAGIGLYGLMSFTVVQRTREIGIRLALGAGRRRVKQQVLGHAMRITLIGLILGIAGAVAAGRLMESVVFGVRPSSPTVLVLVSLIVGLTAYVASYLPVARASRIDPIIVLRQD